MTDPDDCDFIIVCGGNAKPTDTHLASKVVAIDDEVIAVLRRRERQRQRRKEDRSDATITVNDC
jgi:fructose-specific component phosphotransferase system IIB-like protein